MVVITELWVREKTGVEYNQLRKYRYSRNSCIPWSICIVLNCAGLPASVRATMAVRAQTALTARWHNTIPLRPHLLMTSSPNLSPRHARRRSLCSFADNVRSLFLPGSREEKISYIGASLQSFTRLKNLDLSCNSLVSLEGLHSLRALEKLNLWVVPAQLPPFLHEQSVCRHCARMARMAIPLKAHTCDTATCRRDSL